MTTTHAGPESALLADETVIPMSIKSRLVADSGLAYKEFRQSLRPHYGKVWRDITAGFLVAFGVPAAVVIWAPAMPLALVVAVGGALIVGYALAFINNFFHESAHYNLLPDREKNDLVTNVVMGWLFGSSIATYRKIHFQHHRALGTTADSENSYFDPLGTRYLVEGLLGLKVLRTLRRYHDTESGRDAVAKDAEADRSRVLWLLLSAFCNGSITLGLAFFASFTAAAVWALGVLMFFPFFVSLRQVLEHRSENADPAVDYTQVDHGQVNRLFGGGPVAGTLGSAGFNRHLLHHWDPNISYTNLRELEQYLLTTQAGELVEKRQTTYARTFRKLFRR